MSEEPRYSIATIALWAAILGGAVGMVIGHEGYLIVAMGARPEPVAILIFGFIGVNFGFIPGIAFSIVLRRFYREEAMGAASSHRTFWMCLVFASSAIFAAAVGVGTCLSRR